MIFCDIDIDMNVFYIQILWWFNIITLCLQYFDLVIAGQAAKKR